MKITLDGRVCIMPYDGAEFVETKGPCPHCAVTPIKTRGDDHEQSIEHDRITAPAYCFDCRGYVGKLLVVFSTIFGLEEDARVLGGRARVY